METEEIWKDIPKHEGYQVSSWGNFRSVDRKIIRSDGKIKSFKGRQIKYKSDKGGYFTYTLCGYGSKNSHIKIHRIIAELFIPNSNNYPSVNHINGKKNDNRVENLEWCTVGYNNLHSHILGLNKGGIKPIIQFDKNGTIIKEWESTVSASRTLSLNANTTRTNLSGRNKTAYGFIWKFKKLLHETV